MSQDIDGYDFDDIPSDDVPWCPDCDSPMDECVCDDFDDHEESTDDEEES